MKQKETFLITKARELISDNSTRKNYWWSLGLIGLELIIIGLSWNVLPVKVPLWYSLPWGEERLATKIGLNILPILGLIITGLNITMTKIWLKEDKVMAKMLSILNLLSVGLGSFVLINIILVVT